MSPQTFRMYRHPVGVLGAVGLVALLAACARLSDTAQGMFVSTTPAVATVGAQALTGKLHVYANGAGFIALEGDAAQTPVLRCSGDMPTAGLFSREIHLRCNNGVQARLGLGMRTHLRGFGYGGDSDTPVGLAFGLEPAEVLALLKWPPQWRLGQLDGRYTLTPVEMATTPLPPVEAATKRTP